jgi:hypothetical protein
MPEPAGVSVSLAQGDEQDLVRELTATVLEKVSPDELDVLDETADEYFEDPEGVLGPGRKDEAVGFGLEAALITPVVLAVATSVVRFLASLVADAVKESTTPVLVRTLRRLLRIRSAQETQDGGAAAALTAQQVRRVHAVALQRATDLGLQEDQARLLADAVAGGVVVTA